VSAGFYFRCCSVPLAALLAALSLFVLLFSTSGSAQGIAVPPRTLDIPDLPCMTPAERRQLQRLADEYSVIIARQETELEVISSLSQDEKTWERLNELNPQGRS